MHNCNEHESLQTVEEKRNRTPKYITIEQKTGKSLVACSLSSLSALDIATPSSISRTAGCETIQWLKEKRTKLEERIKNECKRPMMILSWSDLKRMLVKNVNRTRSRVLTVLSFANHSNHARFD